MVRDARDFSTGLRSNIWSMNAIRAVSSYRVRTSSIEAALRRVRAILSKFINYSSYKKERGTKGKVEVLNKPIPLLRKANSR